ncbi:MAG: cupredoxin domain-containing protein [Armatimonadota bacterium]
MMILRWRVFGLIVLAGLLAVGLTGCPPRTAGRSQGDGSVGGTQERLTQVAVEMTEFAFTITPERVPAGDVIFNVRNTGNTVHVFEIEGQGIERETPRMQPGERTTLQVENMRPGTYEVYCPVGNHEERGMRTTFIVTEAK